jgi:hypothetical protein
MKKYIAYFTLIIFLFLGINNCFSANNSPVKLDLNWSEYLAKQDLVWNSIPKNYFEGAYVGNGLLGTILYKDAAKPNTIRFEIGRTDVYDHRTGATNIYERCRLPIGQLLLTSAGNVVKANFRTHLWDAEITGEIETSAGRISLLCYVPSGEKVIIVKIKTSMGEQKATFSFRPEQGNSARHRFRPKADYVPNPPFVVEKTDDIEVITQPLLVGDDYATAWNEVLERDSTRSVYVTVANRWAEKKIPSKGSAADAIATLKAARKKSEAAMKKAHRQRWHNYYPASFATFPDPRLESFYWIQQYRVGSAGHAGQPPIDLLGPWYLPSVWQAFWLNLNVQLTYYFTGVTNHTDMEEPLYNLLDRHADKLSRNVPEPFRNECAAILNPAGYDDLSGDVFLTSDTASQKPMNIIVLPWLVQQYYTHYRFTMDEKRLRNHIYPLMKKAFAVYLRILYKGSDGKYHLPLTFSDEYGNDKDVSMNIALARWGFKTLIDCNERLKMADADLPRWKDALANMVEYPVDERGVRIGRNLSFNRGHRHYSHMFAIFPLYETNLDNCPEMIPVWKKTVENFTNIDGDNCMFKFTGASSVWAALGNGNEALHWLNRSMEFMPNNAPTITPNGFYSESGPPTFESPASSVRSALDMLLQSWGNKIRVFPALPDAWTDVSFHKLRAEGAFLVSATRQKGKTRFVSITSLAGEPCIIKTDIIKPIIYGNNKNRLQKMNENEYQISIKKGETVVLIPSNETPDLTIRPLPSSSNIHYWGGK